MKRFIALASCALVLSIVRGASGKPEVIKIDEGSRMSLQGDNIATEKLRCTVETSEGKTYEFYPTNNSPGSDESKAENCKLRIWEVESSHAGLWTLRTYISDEEYIENEFSVRVAQTVDVKPSSYISINAGQWATVWLDGKVADVKACAITSPFPESKTYDLINDSIEGMVRYRGCGVRMLIDKERGGEWKLSQQIGDLTQSGTFSINVPYDQGDKNRQQNYTWNLGESGTIDVTATDMTFCQITRPDGTLTHMMYGRCRFEIPVVTEFHDGTWWASYGTTGKMELDRVRINVETWDLNSLTAEVIPGPGQEINLLCRTGVRDLKFCGFMRPDKYVIHSPVGVGNDNYSYYGDGYQDKYGSIHRRYADCGLTIHKPWEADFGLWNCEMGVDDDIRGTVLDVVKNRAQRSYKVDSSEVFVKRGDKFEVRCKVNAMLDYCWLTSPNGTIYSVLAQSVSSTSLKYVGKGFGMGECGAVFNKANTSENGEWTCHLGIKGDAEVTDKVVVHVTESYIIPLVAKVHAKKNTTLACRSFLDEEGTVQYCRWVRPNGTGINSQDAWRYRTVRKIDRCELTITAVELEDIGEWTCVAMNRASNSEEWAKIELMSLNDNTGIVSVLSIALGIVILVVTLIGAFFAGRYFCGSHITQRNEKSPPPYDPEDYDVPCAVKTDFNEPNVDKDCKRW